MTFNSEDLAVAGGRKGGWVWLVADRSPILPRRICDRQWFVPAGGDRPWGE